MRLVLGAATLLAAGGGCTNNDDDGGGGGGAWLVGEGGLVARLGDDGTVDAGYDLGVTTDLFDLACRDADRAFVVGEGGVIQRTVDGGAGWDALDLGTRGAAQRRRGGRRRSRLRRRRRPARQSSDGGDSWTDLMARGATWRSVATSDQGAIALAIDDDGYVWRWNDETRVLGTVTMLPGARVVAMSRGGSYGVVVGDAGLMAHSDDAGVTWTPVTSGATGALYAAAVTDDDAVVAVGDAGTVVQGVGGDVAVTRLPAPGAAAWLAVQLGADGHGVAAGDNGDATETVDAGLTWTPLELDLIDTVYGIDGDPRVGRYGQPSEVEACASASTACLQPSAAILTCSGGAVPARNASNASSMA